MRDLGWQAASAASSRQDAGKCAQYLALVFAIFYTLLGIAGFFVTGFDQFAARTDEALAGFGISPLHNIVHVAIGLAGVALWKKQATTRTYGWLLVQATGSRHSTAWRPPATTASPTAFIRRLSRPAS